MTTVEGCSAVIYDSHPLWIEAVEPVLIRLGVAIVGTATDPKQALDYLCKYRPALFVAELGSIDGITHIRHAHAVDSALRIVVLSMSDDREHIDAAFAAGAAAYVVKTADADDLASAIRQSFNHSIYLPGGAPARPAATVWPAYEAGLTRREIEILKLAAEGHSNAAIARMLWITEQTAKFHLSNVYRKIGVSNRTAASRWAQQYGLLDPTNTVPATTRHRGDPHVQPPAQPTEKIVTFHASTSQ